ncbi:MAG: MATE family efflux transporter [Eubacteriales bacterium]|nr:MATE family efflux transporter [Eubacteriales bacterium]
MDRSMNMTTGSPTKLILRLAFPLILTNLGQQLYSIMDAAIVGRGVGVEALASLGATDWVYWLVLWSITAMTQGFSALVSQTFGSGNQKDFRKAVAMSVLLCTVLGVLLTAASMLWAKPLLQVLHTPENIFAGAQTYLTAMYAGTLIVMAYNMSAAILRSVGDGKSPLIAMGLAGTFNVLFDLLFVLVFHWGIIGAAFATLLAQMIAFLYCFRIMRKSDLFQLEKEDWKVDRRVLRTLCKLGLPLALEQAVVVLGGIIAQAVINTYGYVVVAGFTATNKLHGLLDCSATALGFASSTYIGQNWGAGRLDRVKSGIRRGFVIAVALALLIMTAMILFGRQAVGLFISADAENAAQVLDTAYQYLFIMSLFLVAAYLMNLYRYSLQGLGDSVSPMLSGFFEFAARSGAAVLLPHFIGITGLFCMDGLAWTAAGIFQLICFYYDLHRIQKKGLAYQRPSGRQE